MEQLVALLQQAYLIPSPSTPSSGPVTNHIAAPQVSFSYTTPSSLSPTSAGIINSTTCSSLSNSYWLIDFGANEHICCDLKLFTSYHSISPVDVTLPNGSIVTVTHAGNITSSPQFYLTNVLFLANVSS
jgi:hypothetical protein